VTIAYPWYPRTL